MSAHVKENTFGDGPKRHVRSCSVHCWQRWPTKHKNHGSCCRCEIERFGTGHHCGHCCPQSTCPCPMSGRTKEATP